MPKSKLTKITEPKVIDPDPPGSGSKGKKGKGHALANPQSYFCVYCGLNEDYWAEQPKCPGRK